MVEEEDISYTRPHCKWYYYVYVNKSVYCRLFYWTSDGYTVANVHHCIVVHAEKK